MTKEVSTSKPDDARAAYEAPRVLRLNDALGGTGGFIEVCAQPGSNPTTLCSPGLDASPGSCSTGLGADPCAGPGSLDTWTSQ